MKTSLERTPLPELGIANEKGESRCRWPVFLNLRNFYVLLAIVRYPSPSPCGDLGAAVPPSHAAMSDLSPGSSTLTHSHYSCSRIGSSEAICDSALSGLLQRTCPAGQEFPNHTAINRW